MKTKYSVLLLAMLLLCSACERTLDFEGPSEETETDLVINAIAVVDTSLTVFVNKAYVIGKTPSIQYWDYEHALFYKDDWITDYQLNDYYKKTAVLDADVEALVNGRDAYRLTLAADSMGYHGNYIPHENDHIVVTVKTGNGMEAKAETMVPSKPHISIETHEILTENPYRNSNSLVCNTDTVMRLTCRISDGGGNNYYRLRIRCERTAYIWAWKEVYYTMQDVYFSDDDLFLDERLNEGFGGWSAYFTNIFDNSLFSGGDYSFTLDSPMAVLSKDFIEERKTSYEGPEIPTRVMVELQAITPELYRYLKSAQLYRITASDAYAEPVQIYSNVQNGWGILGALSYDRHFVEYGE